MKKDPVKDPTPKVKKDPGARKDPAPKKDPTPLPPPTLEKLDPFDLRRELGSAAMLKSFDACCASAGVASGTKAELKVKVEGATGRVLEATATDGSAAARCIAKTIKAKVTFPRFKQKTHEFKWSHTYKKP